jgi:outer membrane protein OmpA-like peptidoglycan-associated protein
MRILFLIPALAILSAPVAAFAQEPSPESIRCSLDPACHGPVQSVSTQKCPPGKTCRSLEMPTTIAPPKQTNTIDLNIAFEFNSAVLRNDARITLDNLGTALKDPSLAGYTFLIGGHTNAKGRAAHNVILSQRRAQAVRDYLVSQYHIPESRLRARGFGSSQLRDPEHPEDEFNRRVQIVNTSVPAPRQ